jgi:transcriptional regulator with XRE-family HTH domain
MKRLTTLRFDPKKLRAAREGKDLGLSEAAGKVGISRQRLHIYEHKTQGVTPNPDILLRLCVLYDIDLRELSNRRAA